MLVNFFNEILRFSKARIVVFLFFLCFLKFDLYSQVIVDSAESKLYLDSTIDGVPIIGINAPDDGISQNKFFEYNVGNRGLIINNSIDYGLSKLGGYILGNSNFKDKEAEHILFDVTGLNISKLEGIQEIVGSKANFILSNPNGLYINGYGFINTNLVRLTTAEPAFTNQGLSYNISKGSITIGEEGLLLDQVSVADLIAKEIRIEGNINFSNPLRLLAGSATIDRISGKVTPIQSESQRIAIDISGDLNAGSIEIISTDEGAGVNSNGSLIFVEDFINISSSGEVTMVTDVVASGSVKINSKDTILSNNNVFAQEHLIVSSNLLNLSSSNVTALDTITFNLNDHISEFSQVISSKVTINADQQVLKSVNIISNSTQIDGDNIRISSESVIVALDRLLMSVDQLYHDSSLISSNMQIIISANNVINMGEITSKLLDIHSKATISNLGTIAGDRMTMVSPTLNNDGYINTRDDLLLNIDQLNQFGLVLSYGDMFISSNVISNFDDGRIFSGRHLNLLSNDFLNLGNVISVGSLSLESNKIYNRGAIVSEGDISTSGYGNMSFGFHNIGLIQTKSSFLIEGDDFLNDGYIEVDGRLSFKGDVMNNSGEVQVTDKANFRFNTLKNTGDFFVYGSSLSELPVTLNHMAYLGGDVLVMNGDFLDNSGKLYAKNALVDVDQFIQSGMFLIDNNAELKLNFSGDFSGISSVGKTFDLSVGEAFNLAGDVYASTLNMIVENVNIVSDGQIFASLRVTANSKFNNDGVMIGDDFSFVAHDEFHNSGSVLASNIQINSPEFQNFSYINASDSLHISANSLYNNGAILGKGALFKSQDFINFNTIIFDDFITIDSGKLKNTSHGKLIAGNLFLDAKFFENYGKVMSTNLLWLDSTSIKNFSEHDLALGDFSKGLISEGNLVLDSDYIDNSNGLILGHDLLISANYDFINDQGHILDYGDNSLLTSNYFQNLSGRIESNGNLNLIGSVLNKDGFIYTFNDLSMGALNNTDGKVYSGVGDITIDSEDIFINDHAQLIAMNGDVLLNVNSISNINGFISASRNILIQLMNDFHHYSGDILAGQSINIYAKDISFSKDLMTNSYLGLVSRENIVVSSNSVLYSDHLDIQAENDLINNGVIESNVLTTISFGSVFENYGNVRSYGGLYLMSDGEVDSKRITNFSEIISGGPLFFDLDGLSMINDGSIISNSGLRLRLFDINNSGLILSMSDAEYNIQNSLINSGDLLSNGLVSFHNNESSMVLMKNFSGLIESVGDMKIKSETLENLADYRILDLYNDQIPSYDYFGANETIYKTKSKLHPVYPEKYLTLYHSQDLIYHRPATIQSRGEIHIDSKNIDNVASSIVSGTNLLIMNDADVHNYSVPLNYTQRTYYVEAVYQFTEQAPCQKNTWTCWGSSTDKYWYKDHIRFYDESYTKVGASAQISAQGLLSLDGDYSAHSVAISHGSDSKLHIDGADPVESVSFSNIESELQSKRNLTIDSTSSVLDTINHFKESKRLNEDLLANNRLELSDSANDFVNIEEVDFRQIINMMKKKNSVGTYGLSLDKNSESSGVRINAPVLTHGILPVASILIKNRYPRTRMESDPSRSVYIEHPGFQSKQDLIQSDYFYTRINLLYPNAIPLGSEYIEQRFMEHFLDSTLGRRLLYEDVDSMLDQMNIWYANAARLADEFKVPLGNPLSKTIVANLSKDILWMEVVNMDGQEVIVPRLYLSKETKKNLSDSGNRAGLYADILLLNHGDVRLNSGGLKANVFMGEIESLNNDRFSLIDVGYIDLISKKNIVNNGRIESTHHLSLVSMSGDILNKSVIGLDYQGNEYMISKGQLASQGDIFLNANKIINDSSLIEAKKNMFLNSKDNVEFKSRNLSSFEFEGNTYRSLFKFSQEQEASKLRVGGELVVGIEGDFNVFGGEVLVTDGTIGQIKGDFNIFSNQRGFANGEQKKTEKSYFLSKAESYFEKVESGFFQDRSVVDLGLNSTVFVDGELTILGSQVNGGDLALIAQKGINILGAHEKKTIDLELGYSYVFSNSNSVGHESELAVVGSNLTTQGTLRMDTEFGDITIVGSQLNVSSNLGINSENNIFILNDFDIKDRTSDKLKMGFFDYIDLSFANQRVQKNDVSKTVVGSDIFVDGNMVIGAGGRFHKTGGDLLVVGDSYIQSGASYFIAAKDSRRFSEIKELATFKGAAADFDFFRLSAGVSMHDQIFESNRVSESETVVEGRNLFGGNLTILADQNIEVRGERLITNEDIHLKANHIGVYSSQATEVSNESHLILDRRIRFGIGNAWADTAHQVVDTYEAFQDAYNQLDDTYESKLNFGSASLKLMQSTAQGAKLAQNVARSASTAGTFGFYGSVSEKGQGEYHQISSSETVNHAGGLISRFGNVNLSGSEMDLIGSHLIAEDGGVNLNINKIRVSSSQDFRNHMTVSKSISYQRELASTALITALPSLSTQHSESHVASSQNLNSQIWGNDIQVYSDEFRLNGGNLIGNQIQIDTDSLIVESNMDMYESRHNSRGISFGGTSGVSDYNHKIKSDWVGSISGIESKAGGRIKTNELNLIGGYILNSNDDDSKRLIIDSEHIFSNHLEGMTKNSSHGFSINISFSDDSQMGVDKINFGYSGLKTTYHQQIYSTIDNADNSFFNSRVHLKKSINQDFINMEKISHQINSAPLKIDLLVPSRFISCTECTDVF